MQLANSTTDDHRLRRHVRPATRADADAVTRLLRVGAHVHVHIDWRPPGEWLGTPGFVVYEKARIGEEKRSGHPRAPDDIGGCLAVGAEPLPAAWVRVAAVDLKDGFDLTQTMFADILERLDPAITEIAWFLTDYWPLLWLEQMGFEPVNEVVAFRKDDLTIPPYRAPAGLQLRPVLLEELPELEAIEAAAFEPRWRHSASDLARAWRHSLSFDVALLSGRPVAFQLSTGGEGVAHLSRMTVHPDHQGQGIGAALLAKAIDGYRLRNLRGVSLNTQSDNLPSQRLYERFGFRPTGYTYPVWSYFPRRDNLTTAQVAVIQNLTKNE
jgi:ribosomal protein S18 acetylase RimI-like enzyme